ncbi:MAG: MraZ protein [Candidatus Azotimanducaceae bacterium]|jgi:MraZ protein
MFRGGSNINLDAKGRLAIPTRYRDFLLQHCNGEMVVTIDADEKCLLIYPRPEWEDAQTQLESLSSFEEGSRRVQRLLIGYATDIEMDGSGRLQLTPILREHANLEKKTFMFGQGKKFELWSEDNWNVKLSELKNKNSSEGISDELKRLSI